MNTDVKRPRLGFAALGIAAAMAVGMGEVRADIVRYGIFTSDHCSPTDATGQNGSCNVSASNPGGLLTVTDNQLGVGGAIGTLSFNIQLAPNYVIVGSGFDASFAFNLVNNPTITYANIIPNTYTIPGGSSPSQNAGSLHVDGFGDFEYGLDRANGFGNNGGSTLSFSISGINLDVTDLGELSGGGNPPALMALDVGFTSPSGTVFTGAIDLTIPLTPTPLCLPGTCPAEVPEPASLALLGTALAGLGLLARRRKGSNTNAV